MKMLLLEDNHPYAMALREFLSPHTIDIVDDLLDFDYMLYESPGVEAYDRIILDLHIEPRGNDKKIFRRALEEEITELKESSWNTVVGIDLLGLDYFQSKILKHQDTAGIVRKKFLLISGHALIIRANGLFEKNGINFPMELLLDKGDQTHAKQLAEKILK